MRLEHTWCDICGPGPVRPVGVGEDFEHWTSPDSFLAVECCRCGLYYLDPRPAVEEFDRIYPSEYHAFDFSSERYGIVYKVRQRLEARRLLTSARHVPADARIVDVGCGDGFHLDLLRSHAPSGSRWRLIGVDPDVRAADAARARGLEVHGCALADAPIEPGSVDLVYLIQTIEHVPEPAELLRTIASLLRPGGQLVVVTDNTGSPDFRLFRSRHWGGWHFPRHLHLYNRSTLSRTGELAGLQVEAMRTIVSPVNWVYSVRNLLVDLRAPEVMVRPLALDGSIALGVGTIVDLLFAMVGRGALLQARFRRPER